VKFRGVCFYIHFNLVSLYRIGSAECWKTKTDDNPGGHCTCYLKSRADMCIADCGVLYNCGGKGVHIFVGLLSSVVELASSVGEK
jgi:hypothetical protein